MKAARFHAKEDVRIEHIEQPTPGPGEVKIRTAYSGICGSDLHLFFEPESTGLKLDRPHPTTGAMPPQVMGHEFSGTIVELGEGVTHLEVGDRVAVWPVYYCGECAACERGMYNVCKRIAFHGLSSHGGGMAEYTTVAASKVHVLPESVDLRMGALVEPMAVAWHAVDVSGIQPGQSALISGGGPIGIGLWFALRARGIDTVLVSEPSAARREALTQIGATLLVDPLTEDLSARVRAETIERGVDVVFDAAGVASVLTDSVRQLAPGGRVIVVAIHEKPVEISPMRLVMSELSVGGALGYLQADFDAVIAAMAEGLYTAEGWVSEVPIDGVVEAFHELRAGNLMKVLVSTQ